MNRMIILVILMAISGCAAMPMGMRHQVSVDGESVSYVRGPGPGPTVVFESGAGEDLKAWQGVYDEVALFANTFAYSRPGYSPGLRMPRFGDTRTAGDVAELLRRVLEKTGTQGPYILVGHSIGGLYVLEFARDYPELVAGVVLVDARLPGFTERCQSEGTGPCLPPAAAALLAPPHIAAEIRGIRPSEVTAPAPEEIGDIPVILLAATKPPPGASVKTQPIWLDVQQRFASELSFGKLVIAEGSGHHIQRDAPGLVVDAIRELADEAGTAPTQ